MAVICQCKQQTIRSSNLLSNPMTDFFPAILRLFCDNNAVAQRLWSQMSWKGTVNIRQVLWCSTANYSAVFLRVQTEKVRLILLNKLCPQFQD